MLATLLLLAIAIVLPCLTTARIAGDQITSLPGFNGTLPSLHYSGLLPVDAAQTVFFHYWLIESTGSPSTDPLVVWMNGGPGCSSMEGLLYELGPLHFTGARDPSTHLPTLSLNPYAWTSSASVLFVEHPAGVGFSYALNRSYATSDEVVSQNAYGLLHSFFAAYPEYANHSLYLAGESYAGIYIPTLAWRVKEGAARGEQQWRLEGLAIGNGCWGNAVGTCASYGRDAAGPYEGLWAFFSFFRGHAMLSQPHWQRLQAACGNFSVKSADCDAAVVAAYKDQGEYYVYSVYDQCGAAASEASPVGRRHRVQRELLRAPNALDAWAEAHGLAPATPDSCLDPDLNVEWFNSAEVQAALHVTAANQSRWVQCSREVSVGYNRSVASLLPLYPALIASYRVLIYSGDIDACVPYTGSEAWVNSLHYPVKEDWRPWLLNAQVAGYVTEYAAAKQFTFLTVKGAGHRVPNYQPEPAQALMQRWLAEQPF